MIKNNYDGIGKILSYLLKKEIKGIDKSFLFFLDI